MATSPSFWRRNGLSLVFGTLTVLSLLGHLFAGHSADTIDRLEHGLPAVPVLSYLGSAEFLSSVFENWESEFLQMGLFVLLTIGLRQQGSSESKPLEEQPAQPRDPKQAPWPVRRGGLWLRFYEHSLSTALLALFAVSFVVHFLASRALHLEEAARHGVRVTHGLTGHINSSQFWFESFQNWQSEFFSITALIILSIYLHEKDSAQSKDVQAPHTETGG